MAFLLAAYHKTKWKVRRARSCPRWRLAPNQVAILPLSKKPETGIVSGEVLSAVGATLHVRLRRHPVDGRRYRRQDESARRSA